MISQSSSLGKGNYILAKIWAFTVQMDAQQTESNFILVTVYIGIIMRHFSIV